MKKYLVLGIAAMAFAAVFVSSGWDKESDAGCAISFYGTAEAGKTVTACRLPGQSPCFYTTANAENHYAFLNICDYGCYLIGDGCQTYRACWFGTSVEVNICVPPPDCPCW